MKKKKKNQIFLHNSIYLEAYLVMNRSHVNFQHVFVRKTFKTHWTREFWSYAALVTQMLPYSV